MNDYGVEIVDESQSPQSAAEQNQIIETLNQAIEMLSEKHQILVRAFYFEARTITEIAINQGVCKSQISRQLKTIHKKLKKLLEKTATFRL